MLKKSLMIALWRIQQSQAIISIIFWSLTLTGIFYGYAKWYIEKYLKIPEDMVLTGMLVLFAIVFLSILFVGFIFDRLKFWKEQLTPRDIIMMREIWIPLLKEISEINKKIEFLEKRTNGLIKCDEKIRKGIEDTIKYIENLSKSKGVLCQKF